LAGLAIDGCGISFPCSIALSANGDEQVKVEQFSLVYAVGSLHFIQATSYNIQEREVRFYFPEMHRVPVEHDEAVIRNWIESSARQEGLIRG
jgi:hypothetical protein